MEKITIIGTISKIEQKTNPNGYTYYQWIINYQKETINDVINIGRLCMSGNKYVIDKVTRLEDGALIIIEGQVSPFIGKDNTARYSITVSKLDMLEFDRRKNNNNNWNFINNNNKNTNTNVETKKEENGKDWELEFGDEL